MKKRKLKFKNILIALVILFIIIFSIVKFFGYIRYKNSNYYKLEVLGYNKEEITYIESLDNNLIEDFLNTEYEPIKIDFMKGKYFIYKNLEEYLEYYKDNYKEVDEVITLVNTNSYKPFYSEIVETDISKNTLVLTNKYNKLDAEFEPKDLVNISLQYSYSNKQVTKETNDAYFQMCQDAKKNYNLTLVATSGYRDYELQEGLYEMYVSQSGEKTADTFSARPGHSEHQTGLAIDILSLKSNMSNFHETAEYEYLKDNSYKFGFILRYPETKEHITGYKFEPWHYRYVGTEVAKYIYENDITFDEYYAYYLNK